MRQLDKASYGSPPPSTTHLSRYKSRLKFALVGKPFLTIRADEHCGVFAIKIVHIVPNLAPGGVLHGLLALCPALMREHRTEHSFLVLGKLHPEAAQQGARLGIRVFKWLDDGASDQTVHSADIVQVEFWNTPEMYRWFTSTLPPMRVVLVTHISGEYPAQVVTSRLIEFADHVIFVTPRTLTLPDLQQTLTTHRDRVSCAPNSIEFPAAPPQKSPHSGTRIGYAGTTDFSKLNPRFVELCSQVNLPNVTFPVAGSGNDYSTIRNQAKERGIADLFEWHGYTNRVYDFLAGCDIFGYPLCRETYAGCELMLQQAMWMGVPPVVLPYCGVPYLITHNETGLIAQNECEYVDLLRSLVINPSERTRLGKNARQYALENFRLDVSQARYHALYQSAIQEPKRNRSFRHTFAHLPLSGTALMLESFGPHSAPYIESLMTGATSERADMHIATAPPVEFGGGNGGVLDYRLAFPNEAILRYWTGLHLGQHNRFALAAGEFSAAITLGLDTPRLRHYLVRVSEHNQPFDSLT